MAHNSTNWYKLQFSPKFVNSSTPATFNIETAVADACQLLCLTVKGLANDQECDPRRDIAQGSKSPTAAAPLKCLLHVPATKGAAKSWNQWIVAFRNCWAVKGVWHALCKCQNTHQCRQCLSNLWGMLALWILADWNQLFVLSQEASRRAYLCIFKFR